MKKRFTVTTYTLALIIFLHRVKGIWQYNAGDKNLATIGMYEYASSASKRLFIPLTKVGTQTVNYYTVFDTGSSGITLDATGIIPAAMITTNGFQFTGDTVNVNRVTITSKTAILSFGDATNLTKEYGNLAYANFTIGDNNGNITTKRIPFFLYYKIMDAVKNTQYPAHSADIFGVGPGYSSASNLILSPLSYFDLSASVTQGFKLAALSRTNFTSAGNYVAGLLTIGLTPTDLTSSGFIMHPLTFSGSSGYLANIPGTITYNGTSTAAQILFDTGNPTQSIIENPKETSALGTLPVNSTVTITTNKGFTYTYTTTSTTNSTIIQNPNTTKDNRSILSIEFFMDNQYLTDYTNHQIGLKNN